MKLNGDAIAHKTERGLVRLGLDDAGAVATAADELLAVATPADGDVSLLVAQDGDALDAAATAARDQGFVAMTLHPDALGVQVAEGE